MGSNINQLAPNLLTCWRVTPYVNFPNYNFEEFPPSVSLSFFLPQFKGIPTTLGYCIDIKLTRHVDTLNSS